MNDISFDIETLYSTQQTNDVRYKSCIHSGNVGDIIYSLPTVKAIGAEHFIINICSLSKLDGRSISLDTAKSLCPLLLAQPYIKKVSIVHGNIPIEFFAGKIQGVDFVLDKFRLQDVSKKHLVACHANALGVDNINFSERWLQTGSGADRQEDDVRKYTVIAFTPRYRSRPDKYWAEALAGLENVLALGIPDEFYVMAGITANFLTCVNLLEMARIIEKANVFIGNPSLAYAIAEALKVPRIVEIPECPKNAYPIGRNGYTVVGDVMETRCLIESVRKKQSADMLLFKNITLSKKLQKLQQEYEDMMSKNNYIVGKITRLLMPLISLEKKLRIKKLFFLGCFYLKKSFFVLKKEGALSFLRKTKKFLIKKIKTTMGGDSGGYPWLAKNQPTPEQLAWQCNNEKMFSYRPKISLVVPVYNTPKGFLKECIESVLQQTYSNWELCIADDASSLTHVREIIERYAQIDDRIKYLFRDVNGNICHASNSALSLATGEFIGLLDHDDILWPNALFEVIVALNNDRDIDWLYSDEDKITEDSKTHLDPMFKPDWSPDLLNSGMYTGHFSVYRKAIVDGLNGFLIGMEYSQDYDLAFRISEVTDKIYHIPQILYSWRKHAASAADGGKPYARKTNLLAAENHLLRTGCRGHIVEYPYANRFVYEVSGEELVSIIIPSDNYKFCCELIASILQETSYKNYEILLVIKPDIGQQIKKVFAHNMVRIVPFTAAFNFSAKCNLGVKESLGKYLIFLNDDIKVISHDWIECLIGFFQRQEVGCVSPKMVYEDGSIQYAGMVTGVRRLFGTAFQGSSYVYNEYFTQSTRNVSIMCGACFAIKKDLFEKVNGFDEVNTPINHSDIDLSFKIRQLGLLIVYTPFATLLHYGHQSIGNSTNLVVKKYPDLYMLDKWGKYIAYDSYYPPQLRDASYGDSYSEFKIIPKQNSCNVKFKKQFLFVTHELSLTGAPMVLFRLACQLKKYEIGVTFLSPIDGLLAKELEKNNVTVIIDGEIHKDISSENKLFFANFDLVVANTILSWRAILAAKEVKVPTIYYIHESPDYFNADLSNDNMNGLGMYVSERIKTALQQASLVVFVNRELENIYKNIADKISSTVLWNGVEDENNKNVVAKDKGYFQILHVGSVCLRKGQDVLVDAFLRLPQLIREKMRLVFIGEIYEPCTPYFNRIAGKIAENKSICFKGLVSPAEMSTIYRNSDLYVCSSTLETGPLTVLEAMRDRVPVISTKTGMVPELIDNGKNGFLVDKGDSKQLADAILYFYNLTASEKEKIKDNAYKLFCEKLSFDIFMNNFLKVVATVLK